MCNEVCIGGLGHDDVLGAAREIATLDLRDAPAVSRTGHPRANPQGCVVIGGRAVEIPELQIHQPAAVQGMREPGIELQRVVAIAERLIRLSARPLS